MYGFSIAKYRVYMIFFRRRIGFASFDSFDEAKKYCEDMSHLYSDVLFEIEEKK